MDDHPPAIVERLLVRALASSPYADDIVGDLREAYLGLLARRSPLSARWWYRLQACRLIARYALRFRPTASPRGVLMDQFATDVRLAARALVKRPMLAATVIGTLALGIGANTAVFAMIDALVLHPYTIPDVDRVVMPVQSTPADDGGRRETVSLANFLDWRRESAGGPIDHLSAFEWWEANLMGRDEPEHAVGFHITSGFFAAIGVSPALGRGLVIDDETEGRDRLVVLSDGLWRRRFGADPDIVGQPVLVDGAPSEVVGVMPAGFDFPMGAEIWAPLSRARDRAPSRTRTSLTVIGRLAPGASIADAQGAMSVVAARLRRDFPVENKDRAVRLYSLATGMRDIGTDAILTLWQAAALFVLLIACANIANLLLARAAERGREIAVRLALGSSRGRIVRESMLESALLALAAVPIAIGVAWVFLRAIHGFMPARIVRFVVGWNQMGIDPRMIGVSVALGAAAAIAFGMLPAMRMSRGLVIDALKSDGRGGASPGRQRLRRGLVVGEIALVLPLLVSAILSVRSVTTYLTGYQGYEPNGLLTLKVSLPPARYPDAESRRRFTEAARQAFGAIPAVEGVVAANILPSSASNAGRRIEVAGQPTPEGATPPRVDYRAVSAGYFAVLKQPMLSGRTISDDDRLDTQPVVVISRSMAQRYWPQGDAVGSRMRVGTGPWITVVGISGDVIHDWFDARNRPTMYLPLAQAADNSLMFGLRTKGDPLALVSDVKRALAAVDPTQPMFDVLPMPQVLSERTVGLQFAAAVMALFGVLALILAMLGLYAVMSCLIAQRVREIGVRLALGATSTDVTRLALGQAARLTALGIAIGVGCAIALGRLMEAGLLGVVSSDLATPFGIAALLGVTALASSYLPARRAASVDPMVALRSE